MERITSRDNARIRAACAVRDSEKERGKMGLFFAEGPKLCLELAKNCAVQSVFATAAALEKTPVLKNLGAVTEISDPVAAKLAATKTSQDVFALFRVPEPKTLDTARRILALEAVQDPGNVGTLLRSAAAFGFDAVLLGPGCASPFSPKTLRASMGAAGRLPVCQTKDLAASLQALRRRGVACLAAALYRSRPLDEAPAAYPGGVCLVIGSEGQGLRDETVAACDFAVRIPMTDLVESLNAGVAGSVLLWHFRNS